MFRRPSLRECLPTRHEAEFSAHYRQPWPGKGRPPCCGAMQAIMTEQGWHRSSWRSQLAEAVNANCTEARGAQPAGWPRRTHRPGANPELTIGLASAEDAQAGASALHAAPSSVAKAAARISAAITRSATTPTGSNALSPTGRMPAQPLPSLAYEELAIAGMELPPGWRGYGTRDAIEHPATAMRQDRDRRHPRPPWRGRPPRRAGRPDALPPPVAGASARQQRPPRRVRMIKLLSPQTGQPGTAPPDLQHPAPQPGRSGQPATVAGLRNRGSRRHDAVHRPQRNPRHCRTARCSSISSAVPASAAVARCWSMAGPASPAAR